MKSAKVNIDVDKLVAEHSAILPGEPQAVVAQGETFTVSPYKFPQYGKAFKSISRILAVLNLQERFTDMAKTIMAEQGEDAEISTGELLNGLLDFETIARVLDEATEEIINLIALAIGKPRDWFDSLDADEGLELTGAVLGVNLSFFIQRIAPTIQSAAKRVTAGLSLPSPTSQPTESAASTDSTNGPTPLP